MMGGGCGVLTSNDVHFFKLLDHVFYFLVTWGEGGENHTREREMLVDWGTLFFLSVDHI